METGSALILKIFLFLSDFVRTNPRHKEERRIVSGTKCCAPSSLADDNLWEGVYWRQLNFRKLIFFVRDSPHRPIAVFGYQQSAIVRDRHAYGPAPYIVVIHNEPS